MIREVRTIVADLISNQLFGVAKTTSIFLARGEIFAGA